jgi:hypothetical protein
MRLWYLRLPRKLTAPEAVLRHTPNQGLATRSYRRPDYEELRMREAEN